MATSTRSPETATSSRSLPDTSDDLIPLAATAATSSTSLPDTSDNLILLSATGRRNLEKYKLYQLVTGQFNAIKPTATMYTAPINYVSRPPWTTHRKKSDVPRSLHLNHPESAVTASCSPRNPGHGRPRRQHSLDTTDQLEGGCPNRPHIHTNHPKGSTDTSQGSSTQSDFQNCPAT